MSVEAAIVTLLTGDTAGVNALIAGRIAAAAMPQGLARPNVVYQRIGTRRRYSNDGPTGLARARLQVSCYADTPKAAKQLAAAVREVLDGYSGTVGGCTIQALFLDDERDAPQPPATGRDLGVFGVQFDALIHYDE